MDFAINENHEAIREAIRKLMAPFPDEYWSKCDENHEFPWEFYKAFAAAGWMGIATPTEYGGSGLGVTEAAIVLQEVAASGAGLNGCSAVHNGIFGLLPLIKHGSEAQKKKYLPIAASGELMVAFSVTEPDAGTDTTNISTFARKVPGGYRVKGQKVWTSRALQSKRAVLLSRTTPRDQSPKKSAGMSLFLCPLDAEGVTIHPIKKMGRNAIASCSVFFDDVFVSDEDLIGQEGRGFHNLIDGLNPERILVAAQAVGIGRAALRRAVDYAKTRIVFGRPIGKNQGIQFPLADALARLDVAELSMMKAAWLYDNGMPCGRESNIAKYVGAEAGWLAADRAVQTHGGFGYATEMHVERYFREIRLFRIGPLPQEMVLNYIGEHVLGLPRSY